jgi:hypothetical protein
MPPLSEPMEEKPKRRWLRFGIRTLFVITLVSACAIMLAFPRIWTGDFCRLTIDEFKFEEVDGIVHVRIVGDRVVSSGSGTSMNFMGSLASWAEGKTIRPWLPTWPRKERAAYEFQIDMSELGINEKELPSAVRVKSGMTFVAKSDNPAELTLLVTPNGRSHKALLKVVPPAKKSRHEAFHPTPLAPVLNPHAAGRGHDLLRVARLAGVDCAGAEGATSRDRSRHWSRRSLGGFSL